MRRHGRLFDTITGAANLAGAWCDFRRGKRRRPSVRRFEQSAESELAELRRELLGGCYTPAGFRCLRISEPKRRLIAAAPVRDRVVHHALYRVLAPRLDPGLIDTTFACLPGRGSQRAVLAFIAGLRRHRYVLLLDVRHYFLSIDQAVLMDVMARRIKDRRVLELLATVARSGAGLYQQPGVAEFLGLEPGFPPPGCGLPIGNLTSQWWGNHYLSGLDHFVKRSLRIPHYQRYLDDLALLAGSRHRLLEARDAVAEWLAAERHLRLKQPAAQPRASTERFRYLGYRVSRAGARPTRQLLDRMQRRTAELMLHGDAEEIERSVASYRGVWSFVSTAEVSCRR